MNKFIIFIPYCSVYDKFIIDCINSIENQNYHNFEVVIVNDGGDINILNNIINNKSNYTILDFEGNKGPAFSKWKFIEYIQNNPDKYSPNDICVIVDGDDFLFDNALKIINDTYVNKKCWCTFGDGVGKYLAQNRQYYNDSQDFSKIRGSNWFANHPRTAKLFLLRFLKIEDFQYNGEWMEKCTDRILVYKIFELAGKDKIAYINNVIYNYREHNFNSYKNVKNERKIALLNYCNNSEKIDNYVEDIHIVMCCWKRFQSLEAQFAMLDYQTQSKRIHWHLVNNNYEEKDLLESIIEKCKEKYKNIKVSVTHFKDKFFGYQRFLYIKDHLIKKYLIDYVIIIDDDQIFHKNWVENIWKLRKPKLYTGFYCKKWNINNFNYWTESIITHQDSITNDKKFITDVDYVGTGGSLIDISIFYENSLFWKISNDDLNLNITIYNIEDLLLSFIAKFEFNYQLKRSFLPEYLSINNIDKKSSNVSLWKTLKEDKQILLDYLVKKYFD